MKAHLMYRDGDFDVERGLPPNEAALEQDLELNVVLTATAAGDRFLFQVARQALLSGLQNDLATILYRQAVLRDSLRNEGVVRCLYEVVVEALEGKKRRWLGIVGRYPNSILYEARRLLELFFEALADALTPESVVLFNESFASTNEREGSEIARQVVRALLESRVKVFFVTHMHEFARGPWDGYADSVLFLRARREADGTRTFKLNALEPLVTSFGMDLFNEIFGGEEKGPAQGREKQRDFHEDGL